MESGAKTEAPEVALDLDAEPKGDNIELTPPPAVTAAADVDEETNDNDKNNESQSLLPTGFSLVDLDKDVYSLIFTGKLTGPGFWFGLFMALFQFSLCWLVFVDLIDWGDTDNPLNIPAGNEVVVTIAQAFLMVYLSQDSEDMMQGLEFLIDGYDPDVQQICPHASFFKWALAGTTHLVVGAILMLVIFILLMQETTVFGLGVDFVAMNKFFAVIDNHAFVIAGRGVFSLPLQEEIKTVGKVKIRKTTFYTWARRCRDLALVAALLAGYGVLTYQQENGYFICDNLFVQFGDVFNPGIVEISGMFDFLGLDQQYNRRAVYQERIIGEFRLAYCEDLKRWTMTPYLNGIFEPCGSDQVEILARSGVNDGFDILTTADTWLVEPTRHGIEPSPFTQFSMKCNVCASKCNTPAGSCNEKSDCVCKDGFFGVNCEFENPCPLMTLSMATDPFPPFRNDYPVPSNFTMLTWEDGNIPESERRFGTLQGEYRPIYWGEGPNANWVLSFLGRRWVIFGLPQEDGYRKENVVDFFSSGNYSSIDSGLLPIYASSPADVDTPSDGPTPVDLSWFETARKFLGDVIAEANSTADGLESLAYATNWWVEENQPLDSSLICAYCDKDLNPCKNLGMCDEATQKCDCSKEIGALCEYEQKCTDIVFGNDTESFVGCQFNATCGPSGRCHGCPDGYAGNTCQQKLEDEA